MRRLAAACDQNNPITFLRRTFMLAAGYDPDPDHMNHTLPSGTRPLPDPYCASMTDVYNAASPSFKNQLDSLDATFIIDDSQCPTVSACVQDSWGLRDRATKRTFVALSSGLWNNGPPKYSDFQQSVISGLLGQHSPITINVNPDNATMTILAALAHELGHISWWKNSVEHKSCFSEPIPVFTDISWIVHDDRTPKFQYFGKERRYDPAHPGAGGNYPKGGVDKDKIKIDYGSPQMNNDLTVIYSGEWASIFATVTPDEDFVETYVLGGLIPAMQTILPQGQDLLFQIVLPSGQTANLLGYSGNSNLDLNQKIQWIKDCTI
jgi:hypothetical protein